MKEYVFNELGYLSESTCKKLQEKLDGKTYMNFKVKYFNYCGNFTLIVCTDYEATEEWIKNTFIHCALENL